MKRANNLYKKVYDINNIRDVYRDIKLNCKNAHAIYKFNLNESANIYDILEKLYNKNYKFSKYHIFLIKEPKYRLIMSENVPDKIVNHLISRCILLPALEHKLIDTNVATRINKGSRYAFDYLNKYINKLLLDNKDIYILKIDIKKYFYNIDHEILFNRLQKDIKDKDALAIIKNSLDTTNMDYVNYMITQVKNDEIKKIQTLKIPLEEKLKKIKEVSNIPIYEKNKGLGIGNMTSQMLAVYYLNDVDHFIKEELKCKYYIRYMDDLIILDNVKDNLKNIFPLIENKINDLNLFINEKSRIINLRRGFSFLGYTYIQKDNYIDIKINGDTLKRIRKHLKNLKKLDINLYNTSLISYKGFFIKSNRNYDNILG
jgi:hypothetical protein